MRVFSGTLATETNTFAPMPTGLSSFHERGYFKAGQHPDHMSFFAGPLWAARLRGKAQGWTLVEGMVAGAQPSGTTTRARLRDAARRTARRPAAALPVDMVLLGLHGAMVADGYDDCEGDLLQRVRAHRRAGGRGRRRARPAQPPDAGDGRAAPTCWWPTRSIRTPTSWSARSSWWTCARPRSRGRIAPVAAVVDCEMIVTMHTSRDPARAFVDRMQALEGQDGILSISIAHGFAWGDVPEMGTKVLVYSDARRRRGQGARRWRARLADELIAHARGAGRAATPASTQRSTPRWPSTAARWCWPTAPTTPAAAPPATPPSS